MEHKLVLPNELKNKLDNIAVPPQEWTNLGIANTSDLIKQMIDSLNSKFLKLNITSHRFDDENNIKSVLKNNGNRSIFAGYLEDEKKNVLGLFFYVDPTSNSGNDLMTRNIWPTMIGINRGILNNKNLYYNNTPVFIVNLNTTPRVGQSSFKKAVVCNMLLNFNYLDLFDRNYLDVIPNNEPLESLLDIDKYDAFVSENNSNGFFIINSANKTVTLLPNKVTQSSNSSAEIYRYLPKILPICYIAKNKEYTVDSSQLTANEFSELNIYLNKF
ncbi:hypothetical protein [Streptococcus oralis]|jgi:hypothetical protein|uniref:hypothetical protein n=1 Tax=Streptococcus oralis TaxID=1303 RepID=UPI00066B4784|nr:hypothetical protein [Streptococcus oralis]